VSFRYSEDIIKQLPSAYDSVIVEADGNWRTEDNKYGTARSVSAVPLAADGRSSSAADKSTKSAPPPLTILDEDAMSTNRAGKWSSSTAHISLGSSPAPNRSSVVIDLTLSSDDESEEVVSPKPATALNGHKRRIEDDEEEGEMRQKGTRRRVEGDEDGGDEDGFYSAPL
jgi:E3 SUMO-protein ligase PIAS1